MQYPVIYAVCSRLNCWNSFSCYRAIMVEGSRGGSAGKQILYTYVTSSGDIRYDHRSFAVVIQRKSCARWQIPAPSVPSCVHVNDLSFKMCVFQVVKGPHSCRDCCYCSRRYVRMLYIKAESSFKPLKLVRFKRP